MNPVDITATELRDFAQSKGWTLVSQALEEGLFVLNSPDQDYAQIVFPSDESHVEFSSMGQRVLELLAAFYGISLAKIQELIREVKDDVLCIRYYSDSKKVNHLDIDGALESIKAARQLLMASACNVAKPSLYHRALKLADAQEFIRKVKFRHTEEGSFVIKISSTFVPEPPSPHLGFTIDADSDQSESKPFSRKTYELVNHASVELLRHISADSLADLLDSQENRPPILSYNILDHLNALYDDTRELSFQFLFRWTGRLEEIQHYFPFYLEKLKANTEGVFQDVMAEMKAWYNGYSWDGQHYVYNPFSILNLFSKNDFRDYWFATGTPTFLTKLIKSKIYSVFDLENKVVSLRSFNKFDLPDIEINSLLFQTGYLTIKAWDKQRNTVTLDFPNKEVAEAFSFHLLTEFSEKGQENTDALVLRMTAQLRSGEVDAFVESLISLFAGIAYPIQPAGASGIENHEKYYHTMFYLVLRLLGYDVHAEVMTHTGRIDVVITTAERIYIVEFKLGDAASAMAQIKAKRYHEKYLSAGQKIVLLGIGFDTETRNIGGYLVEELG